MIGGSGSDRPKNLRILRIWIRIIDKDSKSLLNVPGETDGVGEGPIPAAFIQPPIREELAELSPSAAVGGEETLQTK
jgi:hypothetical protein